MVICFSECIECVSCSNNTIRAACTSKFIDIDTLCEVLNYRMTDPSYYFVSPAVLENFPHIRVYDPDCEDFTLHEVKVSLSSFFFSRFFFLTFELLKQMIILEKFSFLQH